MYCLSFIYVVEIQNCPSNDKIQSPSYYAPTFSRMKDLWVLLLMQRALHADEECSGWGMSHKWIRTRITVRKLSGEVAGRLSGVIRLGTYPLCSEEVDKNSLRVGALVWVSICSLKPSHRHLQVSLVFSPHWCTDVRSAGPCRLWSARLRGSAFQTF